MLRVLFAVTCTLFILAACGGGGGTKYDVGVTFNTSVQQADLDSTNAYLRTFDKNLDFLIQESFPPVGRGVVKTDVTDFCATITSALEAKPYVASVSCERQ
ncbi:MAG: hypothetical protein WBD55_05825 [Dehalococcoidia bacterium]